MWNERKKRPERIAVDLSMMHTRYYKNQKEIAEDFGIKNSSRKALDAYAKKRDIVIHWED